MHTKTQTVLTWWVIALLGLGFWGAVGFVAWHFISKWW